MEEVSILQVVGYAGLFGWALVETIKAYKINHDPQYKKKRYVRLRKATHTIFTLLVLFMVGHFAIFLYIIAPDWTFNPYLLLVFMLMNYGFLKAISNLLEELVESY